MARVATPALIQHLETLFDSGSLIGLTDRQLLERFNARRDRSNPDTEAAFTTLVQRHGPMVYHVCRQILQDPHHAEDAFQAVFLVLAHRARSIRDPEKLSNWLYGTALRTARCIKPRLNRQREQETGELTTHPSTPSPEQLTLDHEQAQILHDEIARLPQKFRLAIVLHHLQGLSLEQAAAQLACPHGTLCSRLARAREKLKHRLTKRGVTLTGLLELHRGSTYLAPQLIQSTTRAAIEFATGRSLSITITTTATAIAANVVRATVVSKMIKLTLMTLVPILATMGATASYLAPQPAEPAQRAQAPSSAKPQKTPVLQAETPKPKPVAQPIVTITGRVLDPAGKPVKGAQVYLVDFQEAPPVATRMSDSNISRFTNGETNGEGRFQLQTRRSTSTKYDNSVIMAIAPGFGLGNVGVNTHAARPEADIELQPERIIKVRLVDISGLPVAGVKLDVNAMDKHENGGLAYHLANDMAIYSQIPIWPKGGVTDAQGQLDISGAAVDDFVALMSRDIRFAQQRLIVTPVPKGAQPDARITLALEPARIIEGRVLAADTGQPIPHAMVAATAYTENGSERDDFTTKFRSDAQGHFKINPVTGDSYWLFAIPTGGEPYLVARQQLIWKKGAVVVNHDIKLPRGVLLQGRVTELGTGKPVPGAAIEYMSSSFTPEILEGEDAIVAGKDDGSFQITVKPGTGYLFVVSPEPGYIAEEIGSNQVETERPGGIRLHAHKIIAYKSDLDSPNTPITAQLRPGLTIKGRVTGPEGQPIRQGEILGAPESRTRNPNFPTDEIEFRDSQFELHGLDPDKTTRVSLVDDDHKWGATIDLSADQAGKEVTIKLEPCGQAKARFIGPDGKPIPDYQLDLEFISRHGPHCLSVDPMERAQLAAEAQWVYLLDVDHHGSINKPATDPTGRITFPALIPGAHYRINDLSTIDDPTKGAHVRKDFTVKPGEMLNLGDILIEKPES